MRFDMRDIDAEHLARIATLAEEVVRDMPGKSTRAQLAEAMKRCKGSINLTQIAEKLDELQGRS